MNSLLTGAALIIFAIWDAINNTLVGYFSDRPYKFTKKWGRRFPLILESFIPMIFVFVQIFYPPINAPTWEIFLWLVFMTCIFDTLESIFVVNVYGLFPEKFRIEKERITVATIVTYFIIKKREILLSYFVLNSFKYGKISFSGCKNGFP